MSMYFGSPSLFLSETIELFFRSAIIIIELNILMYQGDSVWRLVLAAPSLEPRDQDN